MGFDRAYAVPGSGARISSWVGMRPLQIACAYGRSAAVLLVMLCGGLLPHLSAQSVSKPDDEEIKARVEFYRRAIAAESARPELHFQLGLALYDLGNTTQAQAAFSEELRMNPTNHRCRLVLGMLRVQQRDYRAAIQDLESALSADPSLKQAYYPLGQAWFHLGNFQKARDCLEKAAEVESPIPELYAMLSQTDYNLGQKEDAVRASRLDTAARRFGLAQAAATVGSWTEADRLISEFLAAFPRAANGLYLKAVIAFNGFRNFNEAKSLLEQVLAEDKDNREARRFLAVLQWTGGNKEAFEKEMNVVLTAEPLDGQAHYYMGRYLLEKGALTSARQHLETAQSLRPSDYRVATDLARVYETLGLVREAEEKHREAVRLVSKWPSKDPYVYTNYAEYLVNQGRSGAALEMLDQMLHGPHPLPQALYVAGIACASSGKLADAEEYLKRAAASAPGDPKVHLALAEVYDRTGRKAEAKTERSVADRAVSAGRN
ncbi:MAG: tetratricopeptide repeat protein [Acidobacteriia bacterium]|nr:tetratricopeptide repeat protein [Terriglobia bacterium]